MKITRQARIVKSSAHRRAATKPPYHDVALMLSIEGGGLLPFFITADEAAGIAAHADRSLTLTLETET